MTNDQAIQKTVDMLNAALERDRVAISRLIEYRQSCHESLADDPYVIAQPSGIEDDPSPWSVSGIGLINGILSCLFNQKIAAVFDDKMPTRIVRFIPYRGLQPRRKV